MLSGTRIAIFHDDSEIAAGVAELARAGGFHIIYPSSATALQIQLYDPLVAAVVLDLMGPRNGGFELIERVAKAPSRPQVIVVTGLDDATIESVRRLGEAKGLNLQIFRKRGDEAGLRTCFAGLEKRETRFGPEHLAEAIDRHYLQVEYQPKVPLETNDGEFAVEALCRLRHPQFGNIYPDQFIAIAEKEGLIGRLTDAVACQAFRDLKTWREQGLAVRLALNVSPELLKTREWGEQFMRRCDEFGIEPTRVTLEITETSSGATLDVAFDILTRLRGRGFTLSIDDFGTGFSSLAMLYKLPFSELKIDKSFTFDLQGNKDARALIESTIGMAQRLGLKVVAEGVETESVFRELRLMGCQHAQGYFISKSIQPENVPQFFADWVSLMRCEPILEDHALPKMAIIQSLLSDILKKSASGDGSIAVLPDFERDHVWEDSGSALTQISGLVLQDQIALALAHCRAALRQLEADPRRALLTGKILQLSQVLELEMIRKLDPASALPPSDGELDKRAIA